MKPEGLPRRLRLRRRAEFLRVQQRGEKHHTRHFLVFVAPIGLPLARHCGAEAGLPSARLGVTVTRKVGNAVHRNRIKRLVREAFRRQRARLPGGLDLVWVAKRDAAGVTYGRVAEEMAAIVTRLSAPGRHV